MFPIFIFIEELHNYLTGSKKIHGNIIRKHSRKLNQLGDLSFPLDIRNWSQIINTNITQGTTTILDYLSPNQTLEIQIERLLEVSKNWVLVINSYKIKENFVHLYLERLSTIQKCVKQVLEEGKNYGFQYKCFENKINLIFDEAPNSDETKMQLTELRMLAVHKVASNIVRKLTSPILKNEFDIKISLHSNEKEENVIICGPVLNKNGVKDLDTTAEELIKKRTLDLKLIIQHKYGLRVDRSKYPEDFEKLSKSYLVLEMLQNRIHKTIKITLDDLQTTHKGPSFIFYNCARITALLKLFDYRVSNNMYPKLPPIESIDFSLLNQDEEWELVYVCMLQLPSVIINSVCDIKLGVVNFHSIISFLSHLSSVFSVYYRRVKVLRSPKEHLIPTLHARIYFITAVEQVFLTAMDLFDIGPIENM